MALIKQISTPKNIDNLSLLAWRERVALLINKRSKFVSNTDGSPNISNTVFDIDANISTSWESVGPTGSGATNIWTALDVVPVEVNWIEVMISGFIERSSGADQHAISATFARKNGGSTTATDATTRINYLECYGGTTVPGYGSNIMERKIQVSSVMFDLNFSNIYDTALSVNMYLTGWGFN